MAAFPETGDALTESDLQSLLQYVLSNAVLSNGLLCTDGGGLVVNVSTGSAWIGGKFVDIGASSVSITDNATRYVVLSRDGTLTDSASGTATVGSIVLCRVVTSAGSISRIDDRRPNRTLRRHVRVNELQAGESIAFRVSFPGTAPRSVYAEVVAGGRFAGSTGNTSAKKVGLSFALSSNALGGSNQATIYGQGTHAGSITVAVSALGSGNNVEITITNSHGSATWDVGFIELVLRCESPVVDITRID